MQNSTSYFYVLASHFIGRSGEEIHAVWRAVASPVCGTCFGIVPITTGREVKPNRSNAESLTTRSVNNLCTESTQHTRYGTQLQIARRRASSLPLKMSSHLFTCIRNRWCIHCPASQVQALACELWWPTCYPGLPMHGMHHVSLSNSCGYECIGKRILRDRMMHPVVLHEHACLHALELNPSARILRFSCKDIESSIGISWHRLPPSG